MKVGDNIRLVKVAERNPGEIPIGYWLEGNLFANIQIGHSIRVARFLRAPREGENGPVSNLGIFTSSPVVSIEPNVRGAILDTNNSTWSLEII
jgi:hypothetical protein